MSAEINKPNNQEILGPQPLLRDVLAELTFKPGRSIPSHVDSVNLGVFHDEAMQLANNCFLDSENKDSGKIIYVTGQRKVLVPVDFFQAYDTKVLGMLGIVSPFKKEIAEKEKLNERYLSMVIRSHRNNDLTFSATDLILLMLDDSNPGASVASLLAGKTKNTLFLRGENTPQLDDEEANRKARLWTFQLNERVHQFIRPEMTEEEALDVVNKAEKALLKQICEKYDLKVFSGESTEPILKKQTPNI